MNYLLKIACITFTTTFYLHAQTSCVVDTLRQGTDADWLIVGAGPAGISTIGVLIDIGIDPKRITWIDPSFTYGNLQHYPHVPANNTMQGFIDFIVACDTFKECTAADIQALQQLQPQGNYELRYIFPALQHMTDHIRTLIKSHQTTMTGLHFMHDAWHVATESGLLLSANHVVLATGSHPKTLPFEQGKIITLETALNPETLASVVSHEDRVAVLGSSHSAILILKFLCELATPVQHIINFYRHPIEYAVDMGSWSLGGAHSIKGIAAQWAREVLEKNPPAHLTRHYSTNETLKAVLPLCTKVIYALGFERNNLPLINGATPINIYNETTGFIAPRLFGIGIAFPELWTNPQGNQTHRVGLNSFMEYAQRIIPQWTNDDLYKQATKLQHKAQLIRLRKSADLFVIHSL